MNNFPQFPLIRPTEKEAMIDYASLQMLDAKTLLKEKEWTSRSVIDADLCLPYVITKSNVGNKSSNFYHWQSRVACDSLTAPSPIRAWYDQKL